MKRFEILPNQFRVADFVSWQREGSLNLSPAFQRRSVWRPGARSYFIDTLVRGLPVPLIFIRERVDLRAQSVTREVVDGQQRLRTVFSYVDAELVPGFDAVKDGFTISPQHNAGLAGKSFADLDAVTKSQILGYRFSVQTLPSDVEDRDILQIFARMNSTGTRLNSQELRNAAWFGAFKTAMYGLAYEQLERWLGWSVFSDDQVSRMSEVELVSDLVINMMRGLSGKSQRVLDRTYEQLDEEFPGSGEVERRFRVVMDAVEDLYGDSIRSSAFSRQMHLFTLFVYLYDRMFGLGSELRPLKARRISSKLRSRLQIVDKRLSRGRLPRAVLEAVSGAATDLGRRRTRFEFMASICDDVFS